MDTPALKQLMGAYFHQDWSEDGSEDEVVSMFIKENPRLARLLGAEIQAVLANCRDEEQTEAFILGAGSDYDPQQRFGGYRSWLLAIA